jgi:excisionase family DNA binding protein
MSEELGGEGRSERGTIRGVWLDIDEAAEYLRRSKRTVYKLCAESQLAYHDAAGMRWFSPEDLDAFIANSRVAAFHENARRRARA